MGNSLLLGVTVSAFPVVLTVIAWLPAALCNVTCKGRGICPSCTTRRMTETAAHLIEHVFPHVPVRQWVISFPKCLLPIVLRAIEARLRRVCPGAPTTARFGAVSFPQRFGSALNAHLHLHCCITDGVFSEARGVLRFHPARVDEADVQAVQRAARVCQRAAGSVGAGR